VVILIPELGYRTGLILKHGDEAKMGKDRKTVYTMITISTFAIIVLALLGLDGPNFIIKIAKFIFPMFIGQRSLLNGLFLGMLASALIEIAVCLVSYVVDKTKVEYEIRSVFLSNNILIKLMRDYDDYLNCLFEFERTNYQQKELRENYVTFKNSKTNKKYNEMLDILYKVHLALIMKERFQEQNLSNKLKSIENERSEKLNLSADIIEKRHIDLYYKNSILENIKAVEEKKKEVLNKVYTNLAPYNQALDDLEAFCLSECNSINSKKSAED